MGDKDQKTSGTEDSKNFNSLTIPSINNTENEKRNMKQIIRTIKLLCLWSLGIIQDLVDEAKRYRDVYVNGLKYLALLATIPPLILGVAGATFAERWLIASAGIWCTIALALLLLWATPIGVLLDTLIPGGIERGLLGVLFDALWPGK